MVLPLVPTKQTKQDDTEIVKKPSPTVTVQRGRSSNPSKLAIRNKDRASALNVRDVNLDDVKLMEPKWRSRKFDKITVVNDDQQAAASEAERTAPIERKFTLQDFIVAGIRRRLSAKWRKKIGMGTSAYIVVPKPQPKLMPSNAPVIEEEEVLESAQPKTADEVEYSELMDDDFVVINVH